MVDHIDVPETMHIVEPPVQPPAPEPIAREPEADVEPEPRVREPTKRETDMAEIVANRAKAIAKELHYGEELADGARRDAGEQALHHERLDVDPEPEPGVEAPVVPAAKVVARTAQPETPAPSPAPEMHTVTVQGQVYRVTSEQLQQLASIGAVAVEANNRQQRQAQQQPAPQPQQQQPQQRQQQPAPQQRQPMLSPEESQAIARRLQYGNDHESSAALGDLTNLIAARVQAANPQINPQAVAEYATREAMQRISQQNQLNYNLQTVGAEFPEIFASNKMSQLAALQLHENRGRDAMLGVQKSDLDAYREACNDLVKEFNLRDRAAPQPSPSPAPNPQPPQAGYQTSAASQATRFAAKRAAPRSIQPAQRTLASEEQNTRAPTPSEIVQKMMRDRGQVA